MITSRIDSILQTVSQRVQNLIPSERFYTIFFDATKETLSFPLIREKNEFLPHEQPKWAERLCQSAATLPDQIIIRGVSSLYGEELSRMVEQEQLFYWPNEPLPTAWLGVPLNLNEKTIGALVLENWSKGARFNNNDLQDLTTIARQTATAIENARLQQQLEQKIENLRILNQVGQKLTRGLGRQESEILDLIYTSATELKMDTSNMYIAFYEANHQKTDTENELYGVMRFTFSINKGEAKRNAIVRPAIEGLSGYVIRTKKSFNPTDTKKAYKEFVSDQTKKIYRSWLGVPMLSEGQAFGVIVLRSDEREQAYSADDQEILELLAGQAAVALQNVRLYQAQKQAQEQKVAAENMAIMGIVAAEFAHKMNNLAGTIPVRINLAKSHIDQLDPKSEKIIEQLNKIEDEANGILKAAQQIRESNNSKAVKEEIDINLLLKRAIVNAQNYQVNKQNNIEIITAFSGDIPLLLIEKDALIDTLTSLIKNAFEAINNQGKITVTTQIKTNNKHRLIEIKITDTGKGIPTSDLPKIFDLFYTTKGEKGLGFGLWRDRIFIKKLGGEIDVTSVENIGTTVTVQIPTE